MDFLEEIGISFYKIASFELVDLPLIRYVASKGKPIILSTGMSTLEEIKEAVETAKGAGNEQLALLKCSSAYPADVKDMNLETIKDLKERFQLPVGLSDHSMGHLSALLSVALGGSIIEKHFCISRSIPNPDSSFSMEPEEFRAMVDAVRDAEAAKGSVSYGPTRQEESSVVFRRSVFVVKDMKKGEKFTEENTRIIRPGYGIKPKYMDEILGLRADKDIDRGTPFRFELVKKGAVLFLTNNENTDALYQWLSGKENGNVIRFGNKLTLDIVKDLDPTFIISFNYRHIIGKDIIDHMGERIINLHCSYLPYNRGSSPNFFSFLEDTPKGVTIHQMTEKLDEGNILCQKEIRMEPDSESFESSYEKLILAMEDLFKENWDMLKKGEIISVPQTGESTYHTLKELNGIKEKTPFTWNEKISEVLLRIQNGSRK